MKNKKIKKIVTTILKIGVSVLLFYFVATKIDFLKIFDLIKESNVLLLVLSGVFLLASQLLSSYRLNLCFHSIQYNLSHKSNHILYLIGMFYNFFIPGGIGGDAYKVVKLSKEFNWSAKKLTGALFVDRFLGLTAIGILIVILFIPLVVQIEWPFSSILVYVLLGLGIIAVPLVSYVFVYKVFPSFKIVFTKTLIYALAIQILQLLSILCLVANFDVLQDVLTYLLVFLISVILSIISFAGIGVREYVFLKAANLWQFNEEVSVAIGLLFTFLTAVISLSGIVFLIKRVRLKLSHLEDF